MTDQSATPAEPAAAAARSTAALNAEAARLQTERAFILSMSRGNRWMLGFSVAIAVVGLAGVALMIIFLAKQQGVMTAELNRMQTTISQTQQALAEFHRMGDLAAQANDLARQANATNQAILAADRRAWIAPKEADLIGSVEAGKPLSFTVSYGNTGKEPATNMAVSGIGALAAAPANGVWETLAVAQNQSCEGIETIADGPVVFPSAIDAYSYRLTTSATLIDSTVLSGAQVFYVEGCFAYDTAGDTRLSAYCFYLRPDPGVPPQNWSFRPCPGGSFAN